MTGLYLWHSDLSIELKAVEELTASVTDPDAINAFKVFRERLQALVDTGPPSTLTDVETGDLPWRSKAIKHDLELRGFSGCPLDAPANSQLTVHSAMLVKLRPVLIRSPRPSLDITEASTTVVVTRPDGTEDQVKLPLLRGRTFLQDPAMPTLATFAAVVEALAAVAFVDEMNVAWKASDFFEWENIYRSRAQRLGDWHIETITGSSRPSRDLHEPRLPADLFIRSAKVEDRPKRRKKSA